VHAQLRPAEVDWNTRPMAHFRGPRDGGEVPTVCLVGGTRPEAIKLGPVAVAMAEAGRLHPLIVASGQHPTMFHQSLAAFRLRPDVTVPLARPAGGQAELVSSLLLQLDAVLAEHRPAAMVVQGDTSTTLAGALAGFWGRLPVVHLEAGLRSRDLAAPFPEEGNRRLVGQIASLHLAPTPLAACNLANDGITGRNVLTIGNTVVDAVLALSCSRDRYSDARLVELERRLVSGRRRLVLVTVHRRESWGSPLRRILRAIVEVIRAVPDVEVVVPAHPNPAVRGEVIRVLADADRVTITEPLPYVDLVRLLKHSALVMSDSGGIQEEVASFGRPVLVLREVTERVEAVEAGFAVLVGTDQHAITDGALRLLAAQPEPLGSAGAGGNPFGDGLARYRAEQAIAWHLGLAAEPPVPFQPAGPAGPAVPASPAAPLAEASVVAAS